MRRPIEMNPATTVLPSRRRLAYDRIALVLALLALLGLGALAIGVWRHSVQREAARDEWVHRSANRDSAPDAASNQHHAAIAALVSRVDAIETQLTEIARLPADGAAAETDVRGMAQATGEQGLLEAEQILSLAARQLQLTGNVERALADLQAVEVLLAQQLRQTPQAQLRYLPLRKLLARDIERLRALPEANLSAIAAALETVLMEIPQLPLAFERRPQPANAPSASSPDVAPAASALASWPAWAPALWREIWAELRQWVRIERIDAPAPALLAPHEHFFLRENLRLRLLAARIALLTRDGRSFHDDLGQARTWLNRYFDRQAPAVQASLKTLDDIARLDLLKPPPDLDETQSALRRLQRARDSRR